MSDGNPKYVFVCGLHRSGTTPLGRDLAKLKDCTAFEDTGVPMDEGQFLQDVYPASREYGGPGKFGFAPAAHVTEASPLLTPTKVSRLRKSWERYWDRSKRIRVEKTPGNLLMTRFLQAAFENAYFVVIKRHPVAVSLATQKWSGTYLHNLFDHWLQCHRIFEEDKRHLAHVYEIRYRDYVQDPAKCIHEVASFIGTKPPARPENEADGNYNQKYFAQWAELVKSSPRRAYYRKVARLYERRFGAYGYSLVRPLGEAGRLVGKDTPWGRASGVLMCRAADAYGFSQRRWGWPGPRARRLARSVSAACNRASDRQVSGARVD